MAKKIRQTNPFTDEIFTRLEQTFKEMGYNDCIIDEYNGYPIIRIPHGNKTIGFGYGKTSSILRYLEQIQVFNALCDKVHTEKVYGSQAA